MQLAPTTYPTPAKSSTLLRALRFERRLTGTIERQSFRSGQGLTLSERKELEADRHALQTMLQPASRKAVATELVMPIMGVMRGKDAAETAEMRAEAYFEALSGAPLFALVGARQTFFQNRSGLNPGIRADPPELARLVRICASPYEKQLAAMEKLLSRPEEPPPPSEEELARRREKVRAMQALGIGVDPSPNAPASVPCE